jgi:hypothetical protein
MKKIIVALALFICFGQANAQSAEDKAGVEKAILNYVDAFYQADTAKAYESVVRDLAKRGYYTNNGQSHEAKMSFEQLVRLAQRWKNSQTINESTPRKVTVFEVQDRIASAKVEALWGIDYFHLAKLNGKWMIVNVLWQDVPKK